MIKTKEETEDPLDAIAEWGQDLVEFGEALQDPCTNLRSLSDLAFAVGMRLNFQLISRVEPEADEEERSLLANETIPNLQRELSELEDGREAARWLLPFLVNIPHHLATAVRRWPWLEEMESPEREGK